jgi:UDP-galactopyranose mutase
MYDFLIVGAGFAGSVLAERLASAGNKRVLLVDRRPHIGGNAYDHYDQNGILVHDYGPHIFHTNSKVVYDYLSRFTSWRPYEHRVLTSIDGKLVPFPINLDTINRVYNLNFTSSELEMFFSIISDFRNPIESSEDVIVSRIGIKLYEKFFRNYTRKQWGMDASQLDSTVVSRVPIRTNRDDRYFDDIYQVMPSRGYYHLFENMLAHPNISIMLGIDYKELPKNIQYREMIYTGPIDSFFNYRFGKLPYRSVGFVFETHDTESFQSVATINYPNDHLYTRVTEFKHITGQKHDKTSIVYEYPTDVGDPYYPIPCARNKAIYRNYHELAMETTNVYFCGRLATYRYYNMDQVVAQALTMFERIISQHQGV